MARSGVRDCAWQELAPAASPMSSKQYEDHVRQSLSKHLEEAERMEDEQSAEQAQQAALRLEEEKKGHSSYMRVTRSYERYLVTVNLKIHTHVQPTVDLESFLLPESLMHLRSGGPKRDHGSCHEAKPCDSKQQLDLQLAMVLCIADWPMSICPGEP